jgi:hypothetical protein
MIFQSPRTTMLTAENIRSVGPHDHQWIAIFQDATGEVYEACGICEARRAKYGARHDAQRQDWLNYEVPLFPEQRVNAAPAPSPEPEPEPEPAPAPKRGPGRPRKPR